MKVNEGVGNESGHLAITDKVNKFGGSVALAVENRRISRLLAVLTK